MYRAHDERLSRTVAIKVLPRTSAATKPSKPASSAKAAPPRASTTVVRILTAGEERHPIVMGRRGGSFKYTQKNRKLPLRPPSASPVRSARPPPRIRPASSTATSNPPMSSSQKKPNRSSIRPRARRELERVNLSVTGQVLGTPHYMSPEVCRGMPADPRSDQYSLAIMAYLMISGRLPFDGDAAVEVLLAHLQYPVPPLREAPSAVAAVIDKALAKNPVLRFASVTEFIEALEKAEQDGMAVSGPVETPAAALPVPVPASPTPPSVPLPGSSVTSPPPLPTYRLVYIAAGATILVSLGLLAC